ncbi:peptidyl-tRNA hydrolase [Tremella mesenterica]|uniref:peptidyl-tRNA hydrolase n=1 Tax=Tremella mesenterica TaxID=5217 RepID=A0A4Q1BSC4_TREME|nr:uncharacterized protein TREMEDRAFT_55839 [Tremella mesenterica DSM 1558]EIW72185.1 hypothetical protein TREMEDRAFT_55839 [Tremella mesenterica DSM 1558]RXK40782.1 peptidyl-tRNA hydrolase [Tremella mesenterica]
MSLLQPILISVIAFAIGYQTRSFFSPSQSFASPPRPKSSKSRSNKTIDVDLTDANQPRLSEGASDPESDSEDETVALGSDLGSVKAGMMEEMKLVLVVNDSLKMSKGKIAAQAGHATLAACDTLRGANPRLYRKWQAQGQPKIAVRCSSTEELESLAARARSLNLCARMIQDAGRTQVAPGSKTILGIGPGPAKLINQVTGALKLL